MTNAQESLNQIDNPQGIALLKQGCSETWRELLKCYARRLRRDILISLIHADLSSVSISDIEQETWITAARKINSFVWKEPGLLYHWLRSISVYKIRSYARSAHHKHEAFSIEELQCLNPDSSAEIDWLFNNHRLASSSVEEEIIQREETKGESAPISLNAEAARYRTLLKDENPRHVELFIQRTVYGKPPRELAKFFSLKPHTVRHTIYRIKQKILSQGADTTM